MLQGTAATVRPALIVCLLPWVVFPVLGGPPDSRDVASPEAFSAVRVGSAAEYGVTDIADGIVIRLDERPLAHVAHTLYLETVDRKAVRLNLTPNSIRDPIYALREQLADGSWRIVDPGPETTYTGTIASERDGYAAGSWTDEGFLGCVSFSDGEKQWVQPLADFLPGADPALHVVYRGVDTLCEGFCGMPDAPVAAQPEGTAAPRGGCGGSVCVAQLACDADFEYYTARGSSSHATQDRIIAIINVMNHQYVRDVQITHVITTVLVRTAEPDPYTSNISDTLVCQVVTEWTNNQGAIVRDVAKLFTGRDISGSVIGQATNFAQICDNDGFCTSGLDNGAYCYSQSDFSATFACQTDLAAHEIGHLWGAHHCSCPNSTMNPSITCTNTFNNSGGLTPGEIDAHADSIACLTALTSPPANDLCTAATILPGSGTYFGTNANSSTDGGAIGCGPLSGNLGGGRNDVFWRITTLGAGTVSIDTCGSDFDTMVTVHTGCPATPENRIACNDDCGGTCGLDSCVSFAATSGTTYWIRVAGYAGATGSITLNVDGPFAPGNNACANAFALTAGATVNGSVALATNDGSASCGSSSSNPDVWYTFTAGPCGGTLTVDTCGTHDRLAQDSGMDTVLSIHSGCPGTTGNQLVCNDDASPACGEDAGLIRDSRASVALSANQTVLIRVSHFSTAIDDGVFVLHATFSESQVAPTIDAIPNESHPCGGPYTGPAPLLTNPACMTPVTWSLTTGPAGMTINPATGVVSWPTPTSVGSPHLVVIRATNDSGFDEEPWSVVVGAIPPVITAIPNATIPAGAAYTGPTPSVTDPTCMNPVTWSLDTGPAGMTINASTGVVTWPLPTDVGSPHTVTIRATNGAGADTEGWRLAVTPPGCSLPGCDSGGLDADLDDDCEITLADLSALLSNFGTAGPVGDIDGNGTVDLSDLSGLLSRFGNICH